MVVTDGSQITVDIFSLLYFSDEVVFLFQTLSSALKPGVPYN